MSTGGGLGAILGGMQVDPTRLRRGLGDALMGIGAIGLGQDPFSVMQAQKQGRREEERTQIEDQRYDQEWGMKQEQFGLQKDKLLLEKEQMAENHERQKRAEQQGMVIAAALFPKEAAAVAQTAQMMQGGGQGLAPAMGAPQPPQQGLGGMMAMPQGLPQNITPEEYQVLSTMQNDPAMLAEKYREFLLSPAEGQDPYSTIGKLQADLKAGRITQQQFEAAVRKENYIAPTQADALNPVNMRFPDGRMQAYDPRDRQGLMTAMQQGAVEVGLSVQGATADSLFAPATAGNKADIQSAVSASQGTLAELDNALKILERPEAEWGTGLKGMLSEKVGGVASQVLGTDRAGVVTGPKLEDVQEVRTTLQGMLGRMIPSITNDESGRYTEGDMQRVQAAARATDPKATLPEIKAAFRVLRDVEERAHIRDRVRLQGLDPASDEGLALYANELLKRNPGMDKAKAMQRAIEESGAVNAR
jgi:hypothetical protein